MLGGGGLIELSSLSSDPDHRPRRPISLIYASRGETVEQPILMTAIEKLVRAGKQAGFSVEQMIQMLQTGVDVETLLQMIERRLSPPSAKLRSSRWVI